MLGLHLARSGVEELRPAGQILDAGMREFETHHARKHAADDAGDDREDQIEGADVLVVRRHEPADEKARRRSEEHTSELQSLMRISYAVFCLKKKQKTQNRET